tara:strand:- start:1476 stop:2141 length:666 start_codon:yes stop_codon:yes gene_type:complete
MTIDRFPITFRELSSIKRSELQEYNPSLAADVMPGHQTMNASIKPLIRGMKLLGQARTVLAHGSNGPAMATIPFMSPGEVIVVDAGARDLHAHWGDITTLEAKQRGVSGAVIGGAIRDSAEIIKMNFPLFCSARTLQGSPKDPRGAIDVPVVVGGVTVRPGDVIFGNDDGVVVIPIENVDEVISACRAKRAKEEVWISEIKSGGSLADAVGVTKPILHDEK